jgi:hypothetical protein
MTGIGRAEDRGEKGARPVVRPPNARDSEKDKCWPARAGVPNYPDGAESDCSAFNGVCRSLANKCDVMANMSVYPGICIDGTTNECSIANPPVQAYVTIKPGVWKCAFYQGSAASCECLFFEGGANFQRVPVTDCENRR